jgi:hypothetical protein
MCIYVSADVEVAETVPARLARMCAARFSCIYSGFGDISAFTTAAMNESHSSMHGTYGATP